MSEITTLQEVYNLTDFATDNMWHMDFAKMPVVPYRITAKELHVRCQSFPVQQSSVKYLSTTLHNHVKHQPTTTTQPTELTIPFIETTDMRTTKFFKAWRDVCSRPNDNYVSPQNQRRATILFYHYTPQKQIIYTYRFEYVECEDLGTIQYSDGSNPTNIIRQVKLKVGAVYEM